ncbi:uncharacterized protein PGTG_21435 [Puccinia graminis f. sp. tritici CRL 75-36-700-3]|uniref:Uncharacterized protein n=1 Tax=Puccinia graminis f. sp. tritici (strain CRL 75-36-700-3 / race SCCL) TaxID=418459 RepID=H6QRB4_PUCGT|nr:uncharacterized protein PGTG_21435 [Puccinia graminis f. sp. tritici CRL 75-36-700-3]EHS63105.1 hypothetical protein PGTG_21435 [Puccinia graminis f. sp. tritici CRL 75-36-700-3]
MSGIARVYGKEAVVVLIAATSLCLKHSRRLNINLVCEDENVGQWKLFEGQSKPQLLVRVKLVIRHASNPVIANWGAGSEDLFLQTNLQRGVR